MGGIYWGLHIPIASTMIKDFDIKIAIETGTFFSGGAIHLASLCERVITIDNDPVLHGFNAHYYSHISRIEYQLGGSPAVLQQILPEIEQPVLFVLDAHWFSCSPRKSHIEGSQCPLIAELHAIQKHAVALHGSAIIIDDADMFLGSLPAPMNNDDFPSIVQIIALLQKIFEDNEIDVLDDVIVSGPKGTKKMLDSYRLWTQKTGSPRLIH